jgi:flagellar hook-length control protein FliK
MPASGSQIETNNTKNFMDEFEKAADSERRNLEIKKTGEQNLFNPLENREAMKDHQTYRERNEILRKSEDWESIDRQRNRVDEEDRSLWEKRHDDRPGENEKTDDSSKKKIENSDKSQTEDSQHPREKQDTQQEKHIIGEKGEKNIRTIREIIKDSQLQQAEIEKIKGDIKENFTESKKIATTAQIEKIMEKDQNSESVSKETGIKDKMVENLGNQKDKADQMKAEQTMSNDKKQSEAESDKKDNKSITNNNLNLQNNELKKENTNINFLNSISKEIEQINDVKIKKVLAQNNLLEQYQAFREKISHSVENSIKFLISSGESRATIQLHPPELGRVQVDLVVHDNQVTAKINTENASVKEVILTNLDQLKSNLANAGTQINKFEVEVGGFKNHLEQHFSREKGGNGYKQGNSGRGFSQDSSELMADEASSQQALTYYLGRSINCLI